jgi:uncharacterized NAD-dependent epimerase/dehydratase family protein
VSVALALFTDDLFHDPHAKTAHGVLRYATREIAAVIDTRHAGRLANEVVPYADRPVPIVGTVAEAVALGATTMLIGVAPSGGKLGPRWRAVVGEAIDAGLDVEAGLHTVLGDDPDLARAADARGVTLRDLRASPPDLDVPLGPARRDPRLRVVHTVGSDCAIGKMSVVLELDRAARGRGERSVFVATGQTGIAISGWGIAVDHVISDYTAGAAERLVREGADRGDLLFVEGQGSLLHPAYSGVTLGLLHGSLPDVLVLAHQAGRTAIDGYDEVVLPPLPAVVELYERACAPVRPARVAAIALNTVRLDEAAARAAIAAAEAATGLVADDAVRFGPERLLDAVLAATAHA